ncbi:transposase [Streptomyces sp. NPDC059679]|uniref:transposase n=1 Tax=Streptomyces sp. NPDC059679 TaxID=3346903 RepID=UPI00368B7E71
MRRILAGGGLDGWLRGRGITHHIRLQGHRTPRRLGRHRWTVERTMSWLAGCRRPHRRYERTADHFLAFVGVASALVRYRRCVPTAVR